MGEIGPEECSKRDIEGVYEQGDGAVVVQYVCEGTKQVDLPCALSANENKVPKIKRTTV